MSVCHDWHPAEEWNVPPLEKTIVETRTGRSQMNSCWTGSIVHFGNVGQPKKGEGLYYLRPYFFGEMWLRTMPKMCVSFGASLCDC